MRLIPLISRELRVLKTFLPVFLAALVVTSYVDTRVETRAPFPIMPVSAVVLTFLFVMGGVFHNERYEARNHGYVLLRSLPLNSREIAFSKFVASFVFVAIAAAAVLAALYVVPYEPDTRLILRGVFLLSTNAVLVAVGASLSGIFAFGFTKFSTLARMFVFVLLLVPQAALFLLIRRGGQDAGAAIRATADTIATAPWALFSAAVAALYFLSAPVSARLLERDRASD